VVPKPEGEGSANCPRPSRDPEATKIAILKAAEAEFARHGLRGARTEAIAAQMGVTKAMIYYYFKSKEGLYEAVLKQAFSELSHLIAELHLDRLPPERALERFFQVFLAFASRNPHLPRMFCHDGVENQGEYYKRSGILTLFRTLVAILERGVDAGVFRQLNPWHVAIDTIGISVFYFVNYENLKHHFPGTNMLGEEMLASHETEAINLIMAGVLRRGE
jgi:TetR/AcrR family transcriptional regulator